jgi:hypothetical protein
MLTLCRLWLADLKEKNREIADQIHVFSSFFYKKLNNKRQVFSVSFYNFQNYTSCLKLGRRIPKREEMDV